MPFSILRASGFVIPQQIDNDSSFTEHHVGTCPVDITFMCSMPRCNAMLTEHTWDAAGRRVRRHAWVASMSKQETSLHAAIAAAGIS